MKNVIQPIQTRIRKSMNIKLFAVTALLSISASQAVYAERLAGVLYGGATQSFADCYIFNAGSSAVTVTDRGLIDQGGFKLPLVNDNCNIPLAPGRTCVISAGVSGNSGSIACSAVVSPNGIARGQLDIGSSQGTVLSNVPLR